MNKSQLIEQIALKSDLSKSAAERVLNAIVSSVTESLELNDPVTLIGFGSFSVRERSARTGRNPKTGKEIEIPATKVPVFKAGKLLKDSVNSK